MSLILRYSPQYGDTGANKNGLPSKTSSSTDPSLLVENFDLVIAKIFYFVLLLLRFGEADNCLKQKQKWRNSFSIWLSKDNLVRFECQYGRNKFEQNLISY